MIIIITITGRNKRILEKKVYMQNTVKQKEEKEETYHLQQK